jgi:anthranilate/para-aminobenzoate synthase component I
MVGEAKRLIRKGDVAQIVLTNGKRVEAQGSLLDTYEILRRTDPTRYLSYFSSDDVEAAMASPEPIAKLHNGTVMTERLAGSYARGKTRRKIWRKRRRCGPTRKRSTNTTCWWTIRGTSLGISAGSALSL